MGNSATLPAWLQYLQAFAFILIPLVGAFIAWQQARIAWAKLQFELYEKRFAIYAAARNLIAEVIRTGNVTDESLRTYMLGTADVFLLNDTIREYLAAVGKRASILPSLNYTIASPVGSEQRVELSKRRGEEMAWFNEQPPALVAHFKPFLNLPGVGLLA